MGIFSSLIFFKILQCNKDIFNECEPRQYTDWTKDVKIVLTQDMITALEDEYKNCIKNVQQNTSGGNLFRAVFAMECDNYKKNIEQGFKTERVPDEAKRAQSRKEISDYEMCLKDQTLATKEKPDYYKFLLYGNLIILAIGVLIFTGLYQKNK